MREHNTENGFTLIEVLIGTLGFVIVGFGLVALFANLVTDTSRQQGILADQDSARRTAFTLAQEMRNAIPSNTGAFPLESAGSQEVVFYSNLDGGIDVERVRYFLQGTDLKKGITKPTGSPLAYNLANEVVTTTQRNTANGGTALFEYFDGNYTGSQSPLAQPVSVTLVRYVKMNLMVQKRGGGIYTVSSGATVRTLKDNLGN